ncbi:hypothetical protein tb265_44120 [Gemmatimonadetes bacterium T265]|nr:hypothetical protein tb265_44120 [Gemmatimonadetes bacterium T265]
MRAATALAATSLLALPAAQAGAQAPLTAPAASPAPEARPYVFLVTPTAPRPGAWLATAEAGYAAQAFQPIGGEGVGPALSLQGQVTRALALFVRAGAAADARTTRTSLEGELRLTAHPFAGAGTGTYVTLGAGALRAYDATTALRARVGAGHAFARSRVDADVAFDHVLAAGRDPVDVVTTLGWMRAVGPRAHLGVEAVGQDLEGFWDREEAEGGARVFLGPSGGVSVGAWQVSVSGGPTLRASTSGRVSDAPRPLSTTAGRYGLGLRTAISYGW